MNQEYKQPKPFKSSYADVIDFKLVAEVYSFEKSFSNMSLLQIEIHLKLFTAQKVKSRKFVNSHVACSQFNGKHFDGRVGRSKENKFIMKNFSWTTGAAGCLSLMATAAQVFVLGKY